jgi:hypothetical protein
MGTTYNNTFFDLNNRRQYPLAVSDPDFPLELVSDLKISIPDEDKDVVLNSIYLRDKSVRILFSVDNILVADFSVDTRNLLRVGEIYPLGTRKEGYTGFIVFGNGVKQDWNYTGTAVISEECLTRYLPSKIPYAGIVCNYNKLTGEVYVSGNTLQATTDVIDIPSGLLSRCNKALAFQLLDTGELTVANPIIAMANGINTFVAVPDKQSPVFTINTVRSNAQGAIRVHFEDHFKITQILDVLPPYQEQPEEPERPVEPLPEGVIDYSKLPSTSIVAVATDIVQDDICGTKDDEEGADGDDDTGVDDLNLCDLSNIEFEVVT